MTLVIRFWKPISFAILILVLCLFPAESLQKINFLHVNVRDIFVHFAMFFVFSFLLTWDYKKYKTFHNNKISQIILLLLICILYAGLTEFLQYAFASLNRTANLGDLLFDIAGVLAGFWLVYFIK